MSKERKFLLWSIILAVLYLIYCICTMGSDTGDMSDLPIKINENVLNIINYITYGISIISIIYLSVLTFNKKIDLGYHKVGIMVCSILLLLLNIVSGILGIIAHSKIESKKKKEKRELPEIKEKEFTNKYICLAAFAVCIILMFFISDYVSGFWGSVVIYASIFLIMLLTFIKQLIHDFKYFKKYFREYMSLVLKTWLKSLLFMLVLGLIISLVTDTSQSNNQQALQNMFAKFPIYVALLSMFYAPFAEELMFRGVFKKFIKSKYLFILVSGILFGLLHVIDDSKTLAEFSYIIVYSSLGMFLASLYYKTNNLWTNISFHFLQNTLGVIGMLLLFLLK